MTSLVWRDSVAASVATLISSGTLLLMGHYLTRFEQRPQHFEFLAALVPACLVFGCTYLFVRGKLGLTARCQSAWSLGSVLGMWVSLCAVLWVTDFSATFRLPAWAQGVLCTLIGVMNWWSFHGVLEREVKVTEVLPSDEASE